ncbi:hypothetical protein [Kocuria massiliensis]|uniref:hypothetical protein n=1 Tax=Kocuria massiliensis TaxID=1926282 RepID=UPI0022B9B892|nr:hypothetical protein [Kocuria massiliensis]
MGSAERFWSKVVKGSAEADCWIWVGAIGDDGYGRFWIAPEVGQQKMIRAHRYALALVHGGLEAIEDLQACHVCDNPICVRAEEAETSHLYLGTPESNMMDRSARGRHNRQVAAQFFRHETKQARAHKARALRDLVAESGYDHEAIKSLLLGLCRDQGTLF